LPTVVSANHSHTESEQVGEANYRLSLKHRTEIGDGRFLLGIAGEQTAGIKCGEPFDPTHQITLLNNLKLEERLKELRALRRLLKSAAK